MKDLLKKLNLLYKDESLYIQALTHASYAHENNLDNNQKLEFLGDAVIELLTSDYLYQKDLADEGELTKRRAQAVREEALVIYAEKIDLKTHLLLGRGEQIRGANEAMIADAFEALFGAVYMDLGYEEVKHLFKKIVVPYLNLVWGIKDYKSTLQEYIQSGDKRNISYHITKETGPSHDKKFVAEVRLDGNIILGTGSGKTKKEAEQNAANEALKKGNYDFKTII
ncbi:MAG: ribonuclease III [Acholeplasmataceae bacterium]|nr:ribonuclease III [Acholeplasmataceae bacterium]